MVASAANGTERECYGGLRTGAALIVLSLQGCGGDPAGMPSAVTEEIRNGTASSNEVDLKLLTTARTCSATLVRNSVIVTAAHCFQPSGQQNSCIQSGCPPPTAAPETAQVVQHPTSNTANDVTANGAAGQYVQMSNQDVAVMGLSAALTVGGSTLGHSVPVYGGVRSNLDQQIPTGHLHDEYAFGRSNDACTTSTSQTSHRHVPSHASDDVGFSGGQPFFTDPGRFIGYNADGPPARVEQLGDSGASIRDMSAPFNFASSPIIGITTHGYKNGDPNCEQVGFALKATEFRKWINGQIENFYSAGINHFFSDHFDNAAQSFPSFTTFEIQGSTGGPMNWFAGTSSINQQSGITNGGTVAIDNRIAVSNAVVSAHIFSANGTGFAGIVMRYRDPCNFYYFQLQDSANKAWMTRKRNCVNTNLAVVNFNFDWNNGGNGRSIRFETFGLQLTGVIDGNIIISVSDNSDPVSGWVTAGKTGFFASGFGSGNVVEFRDYENQLYTLSENI